VELVTKKKLLLVAGRVHPELATEISERLGVPLGQIELASFPNGERHCRYGESIRGADLFILQTHDTIEGCTINDAIMEQLIMVDAARRASAKRITVVAPFFGYSRQDRKATGREPITAKLIANLFATAGAKRLVSIDLHSGQIQGFFDGPVDHLTAMPVLVDWMKANLPSNVVVVSPDSGRVRVAERYGNHLNTDIAMVHKRRVKVEGAGPDGEQSTVEAKGVVGQVEGRPCVIIDDMIDTAGTICAAAEQLKAEGATEVYAAATHGVLSGPAVDRLKNAPIEKLVITNTLPIPPEKRLRQAGGAVGGRDPRRRPRRGVRGSVGVGHLRRPKPQLTGLDWSFTADRPRLISTAPTAPDWSVTADRPRLIRLRLVCHG
jgi:ribose-phosphate pyrophosphokinase